MSFMKDVIRLPSDLGRALMLERKARKMKATDIALRAGRARDVLYRLEQGEDVTLSSLMAILGAMGLTIRLERAGMPTLEEVQRRFGSVDEDGDDAAPP
ncbi:transcriptional regulator with XRE-family HTH domain [Paucibacter oligotrophus]|uniref:Transcriptional regulator with XRE-family HTH domain n=1 Tax=Roseateles oligotrophus TaxID=1769250 RepID=A0A840L6K5_9BURK|nr:helix-turn-helix transcriptional regulator [Roseateles oligotrophus]MBB4844204.1 transcriptional regulator with XRE-family HTH domain [Roseateles oligotrophus]